MTLWRALTVTFVLIWSVALTACGSDDEPSTPDTPPAPKTGEVTAAKLEVSEDRQVVILRPTTDGHYDLVISAQDISRALRELDCAGGHAVTPLSTQTNKTTAGTSDTVTVYCADPLPR